MPNQPKRVSQKGNYYLWMQEVGLSGTVFWITEGSDPEGKQIGGNFTDKKVARQELKKLQ